MKTQTINIQQPQAVSYRNHVLLYKDTKKVVSTFKQGDIDTMINTLVYSKKYQKNIWGEWTKARDITLLLTIYLLGLRPKEACKMHSKDISVSDNTIHIQGSNNKQGKDRILPLPKKLLKAVLAFLKFPRYLWKGSKFLFPSFVNASLSAERWKHIFREKILKPSGLYEKAEKIQQTKYRSYTLRATRATELLNQTKGDIFLVANFLGHADLRSVTKYLPNCDYLQEHLGNNLDAIDEAQTVLIENQINHNQSDLETTNINERRLESI